jgi:hypothetical protein
MKPGELECTMILGGLVLIGAGLFFIGAFVGGAG